MSALSPAPATSSGAPWADPLTPLDSALTDCCLSYKQNVLISPLESALTKTPGGGGSLGTSGQASLSPSYAPRGASIPCGLTRLRILPVTTGVYHPMRFRFFCVCGKPNWLVLSFHTLTNRDTPNPFRFTSIQNPRSGGRAPAVRVSFCSSPGTRHSYRVRSAAGRSAARGCP